MCWVTTVAGQLAGKAEMMLSRASTPPVDAPGQSDPADGQVDGGDARADASGVEDAESEELVLGAPA